MATTQKLQFIIDAENRAEGALKEVSGNLDGINSRLENLQPTFKKMATAGTLAFGAIAGYSAMAVKGAQEASTAQERMAQILRVSTGASDEQINSLNNQAEALERVGVVSADVIRQGQGQLASFDLQAASIEQLIPSILNYAVAEKGLHMTTGDLQSVTNGLAQAMQGNFASLTKTGFVLDDTAKKMLSTGTETERVAALTQILDGTYGGLNEKMRLTAEGGVVGMGFAMGKLNDAIGDALIPIIGQLTEALVPLLQKFADWAEKHPDLLAKIMMVIGALALLVAGIGAVGLILPAVITTLGVLGTVLAFLAANPIVLVVAGIAFIVYQFAKLVEETGSVSAAFQALGSVLKDWWNATGQWVLDKINMLIDAFNRLAIVQNVKAAASSVGNFFSGRAIGGPVSAGSSYMVGERGPELFTPASAGRIMNNSQLAGMGGGLVINISGNSFMGADDMAEQVGDQILRILKRNVKIS